MKNITFLYFALICLSIALYGQNERLYKIVKNGKIGYIDNLGNIKIKPRYKSAGNFSDGLAPVRLNGKYGYIDKTGNYVIPPKYDYATDFVKGISLVYVNGFSKVIDKKGDIIIDENYKYIYIIPNNKAIIGTITHKYGIFDLNARKLVVDTLYNLMSYSKDKVIVAKRDNKYGVMDINGNLIVPFGKYSHIENFVDGVARVKIADKTIDLEGAIDKNGKLLFTRQQTNNSNIIGDFHNGFAVILLSESKKTHHGYINLKGEIVLNDTLNQTLNDFSDERAFVTDSNSMFRMIDTKLNIVGNESFDKISEEFQNGHAIVIKDDKSGIIDTKGKYTVKPIFENELKIIGNYFTYDVNEDEKLFGIGSLKGTIITKPIFQEVTYHNDLFKVKLNDKLAYVNKSGNIVWQEKEGDNTNLDSLDIDFMNNGYFYSNQSHPIESQLFAKNQLSVNVYTTITDTIYEKYKAYIVRIANQTNNNIEFNAQDGRLYMTVQAQDTLGEWRNIEYLPNSWCGNSYRILTLEPNSYWELKTPIYHGEYKTKFRIELKFIDPSNNSDKTHKKEITIYSNEYEGSVNSGQFWNKKEYSKNDFMNLFND